MAVSMLGHSSPLLDFVVSKADSANEPQVSSENSPVSELRGRVYAELRKLANWHMRHEKSPHTLQPTALIHEAWLRMGADKQQEWKSRAEFFASAAETMRRILVDRARRKKAIKHGGHLQSVVIEDWDDLPEASPVQNQSEEEILVLHKALERLETAEPEVAELVKLHYFAGMSNADKAQLFNVSERTIQRRLAFARTWLGCEMESSREST